MQIIKYVFLFVILLFISSCKYNQTVIKITRFTLQPDKSIFFESYFKIPRFTNIHLYTDGLL